MPEERARRVADALTDAANGWRMAAGPNTPDPTSEDIRALAATLLIEGQRKADSEARRSGGYGGGYSKGYTQGQGGQGKPQTQTLVGAATKCELCQGADIAAPPKNHPKSPDLKCQACGAVAWYNKQGGANWRAGR